MMAMYSNAQKLAAVLNKWAQPAIQGLLGTRLGQLPFIANIDAKLRSTGWVSPMWSISKEISPLLDGLSSSLVEPMLARYLQGIPDEAIPELAHKVVEDAINFYFLDDDAPEGKVWIYMCAMDD